MLLLLPQIGQPRLRHQCVRNDQPASRHGQDLRRVKILLEDLVNAQPHRQQEQRVIGHLLGGRHQDEPANLHRLVRGPVLRARVGQFSAPTGLAVRHPFLTVVNGRERLESPAKLESPTKPGPALQLPAI